MEHVYAPTPDLYDPDTAARIKYHINTLYPLLNNFAKYRFCCKLGLNVIIHPNGQLQIIATLVMTRTCYRLTQDITLKKFIAIKDQLKRAIFEMAQPLMLSSTYCERCLHKLHKHLCNGKIWTTMDSPPDEHSDLISKGLIHVTYLGRRLFVELVKRDKPLEVIKSKDGVLSYVVGELSIMEQESFDKTLRTGLGISTSNESLPVDLSVPHNKSIENKLSENIPLYLTISLDHKSDYLEPSTSNGTAKESTVIDENSSVQLAKPTTDQSTLEKATLSGENKYPYMDILGKMSLKVSVKIFKVTSEMQTIHVTQNLMDNLPTSKYRKDWDNYIPADEGAESDTTLIYWPLSNNSDSDHVRSDISTASPSCVTRKKPTFNINWHGLRWRKLRYWFKCKVSKCDSTFSTIRGWNFPHSYVHRNVTLKCEICGRKFTSPSAHRACSSD